MTLRFINARTRRAIVLVVTLLLGPSMQFEPARASEGDVAIIQNFVRVGIGNAANDFVAIRGIRLADGLYSAKHYSVTTKFSLNDCKISKTEYTELLCDTSIYRLSKKTMLGLLAPVIQDALPGDFIESTDPEDLIANNLLWKRSSDHISVGVYCLYIDHTQTTISCVISVAHDPSI